MTQYSYKKNSKLTNLIPGILYIVATPIGNLQDMSFRAIETLKQVDLIAAEDTRHSKYLLQHYGINIPLFALHEHNEAHEAQRIIKQLQEGKNIAYISDAGTPLISDPGQILVKEVQAAGIKIVPIPGACAAIAALSAAGIANDSFIFKGFLPTKSGPRKTALQKLINETATSILYEAPHRINKLLLELKEVLGREKYIVLAKELTKTFETIRAATISELEAWLNEKPEHQKGEFVILIPGIEKIDTVDLTNENEALRIMQILAVKMPPKQAAELTQQITGLNKNHCYKLLLDKQKTN